MALGPIPFSKIEECADRARLDTELRALFFDVIAFVDAFYIRTETARMQEEADRLRIEAQSKARQQP